MTKDPDELEIFNFVRVDELFEEENQIVEFVKNNYGVDNLVEDCGCTKTDVVVSIN